MAKSSNVIQASERTYSSTCLWIGEGQGCAEAAVPKRNYCEQHLWQVYARGTAVKPRKKREKKRLDLDQVIGDLNELYEEMVASGEIEA